MHDLSYLFTEYLFISLFLYTSFLVASPCVTYAWFIKFLAAFFLVASPYAAYRVPYECGPRVWALLRNTAIIPYDLTLIKIDIDLFSLNS